MLTIHFGSRRFAYRRLAEGLSRSLSTFPTYLHECFDHVIKANQFAYNVVDIGIAANSLRQFISTLRAVFNCNQKAGIKLCMAKCHFRTKQVDFLGETITKNGVIPLIQEITKFCNKIKIPSCKKHYNDTLASLTFIKPVYPDYPYFQFLKTTENKDKIVITPELMKGFCEIFDVLDKCCQLAIRQSLTDKQKILLTEASSQAA